MVIKTTRTKVEMVVLIITEATRTTGISIKILITIKILTQMKMTKKIELLVATEFITEEVVVVEDLTTEVVINLEEVTISILVVVEVILTPAVINSTDRTAIPLTVWIRINKVMTNKHFNNKTQLNECKLKEIQRAS